MSNFHACCIGKLPSKKRKASLPPFKILFPSLDTVKTAINSQGSSSICFNRKYWEKFPKEIIRHTHSVNLGSLMHSKIILSHPPSKVPIVHLNSKNFPCLYITNDSTKSDSWMYLGSHNCTLSAWGSISTNQEIFIRNWELGIVFGVSSDSSFGELEIPLPWTFPPKTYLATQEPWVIFNLRITTLVYGLLEFFKSKIFTVKFFSSNFTFFKNRLHMSLQDSNVLLEPAEQKFFTEFLDFLMLDSESTSNKELSPKDAKKKRELLTLEQKKANHVNSEQRRRSNIRNGFQTLSDYIPTLSGSNHSKSTVLSKACEYIEFLKTENARLYLQNQLYEKQLQTFFSQEISGKNVTKDFNLLPPSGIDLYPSFNGSIYQNSKNLYKNLKSGNDLASRSMPI